MISMLVMTTVLAGLEPAEPVYTGFYTGKVIPTPQQVTYEDAAWPFQGATVDTLPGAPRAVSLASAAILNRALWLSGEPGQPLPGPQPKRPVRLHVGTLDTDPSLQRELAAAHITVPDRPEGYAIACLETLTVHPLQMRDWPTFKLRPFKTGGAFDPGGDSRQMGLWAPFAKFDCYNVCYTTLGQDKWVDPPVAYREHVSTLARHLRERGLDVMPFVNPYYLWKTHIEVSDAAQLDRLFDACRIALDAGGTRVMLCLDDFASEPGWSQTDLYHVRSERDRAKFGDDLAAVNIAMVNDLWRRIHERYPDAKLYVVPPYYWSPGGTWREAGETYLRALGQGIDPAVTIVWTGPQVRSGTVSARDVSYYAGLLGGRKPMLWDNTLYMHHSPPHYFLDTFHTQYADRFWDLTSGEVHLNAGGGEVYKCGLLAAADYLWNPAAHNPETSLRNAVGAIAGPEMTDDLLAFRDVFYQLYDTYARELGPPAAFLKLTQTMTSRPFDEAGLAEVTGLLGREEALAKAIGERCRNAGLVEEVKARVALHAPYREAFAVLAKLPPMTDADAANVVPNPGAEEVAEGRPAGWGLYAGAGGATLTTAEGRTGRKAAKLAATKLHDWPDGKQSINVALLLGDTNGYDGLKAPEVLPLHRYYFRLWVRGQAPRVSVSFVTWAAMGTRESRGGPMLDLAPFPAPAEWTRVTGSFITPANAARGALKIGIEGYTDEGGGLGEILVDDVYVGRSETASEVD
ncbi:MAG: beta-N-acetylglucosaminidase domain-containing protein [Armatimonadetes bacterium]|nr:beta-N-acetylglucosaminidase domain-containing protein [Armatimonadota bacterium]